MPKLSHEKRVELAKRLQDNQPTQAEKDRGLPVREANTLIQRNSFNMSLREKKILYYCISRIKPNDQVKKRYSISARDVCIACGIEDVSGRDYAAFKDAIRKLDKMNFDLRDSKGHIHIVHWITEVEWIPNTATVRFNFPAVLEPYLFNIAKYFTQYDFGNIAEMQSAYGIDLYRLLKSYANIRRRKFGLDELRERLCATSKSYEKYGIFKQKVLDPAMKDIATYSDLKASYVEIKDGRKVIGVEFIITDIGGTAEYLERQGMKFDD